MSETLNMVSIIHADGKKFSWVLVDADNSHVFAQGLTKYVSTAKRQVTETAHNIAESLGLEVVVTEYGT